MKPSHLGRAMAVSVVSVKYPRLDPQDEAAVMVVEEAVKGDVARAVGAGATTFTTVLISVIPPRTFPRRNSMISGKRGVKKFTAVARNGGIINVITLGMIPKVSRMATVPFSS
jgi:hypothetical protein